MLYFLKESNFIPKSAAIYRLHFTPRAPPQHTAYVVALIRAEDGGISTNTVWFNVECEVMVQGIRISE
jgi:hypothetical protein